MLPKHLRYKMPPVFLCLLCLAATQGMAAIVAVPQISKPQRVLPDPLLGGAVNDLFRSWSDDRKNFTIHRLHSPVLSYFYDRGVNAAYSEAGPYNLISEAVLRYLRENPISVDDSGNRHDDPSLRIKALGDIIGSADERLREVARSLQDALRQKGGSAASLSPDQAKQLAQAIRNAQLYQIELFGEDNKRSVQQARAALEMYNALEQAYLESLPARLLGAWDTPILHPPESGRPSWTSDDERHPVPSVYEYAVGRLSDFEQYAGARFYPGRLLQIRRLQATLKAPHVQAAWGRETSGNMYKSDLRIYQGWSKRIEINERATRNFPVEKLLEAPRRTPQQLAVVIGHYAEFALAPMSSREQAYDIAAMVDRSPEAGHQWKTIGELWAEKKFFLESAEKISRGAHAGAVAAAVTGLLATGTSLAQAPGAVFLCAAAAIGLCFVLFYMIQSREIIATLRATDAVEAKIKEKLRRLFNAPADEAGL